MSTSSQSDETILKEKKMAANAAEVNDTQEDDILAVSEQLATDLANVESDEETNVVVLSEDEEDADKEDSTEESTEETAELSEDSDEEADPAKEEDDTEDKEEEAPADEQLVDSKDAEATEDVETTDNAEATSTEEGKAEGQENGETHPDPTRESELEVENKKLKEALRHMLVERVVDAKIARGMGTDRAEMITEHATRTASSLSDSLKDLAHMPATGKVTEEDISTPKVEEMTLVANESGVTSEAEMPKVEVVETPTQRAERGLYTLLNGNAQFRHNKVLN